MACSAPGALLLRQLLLRVPHLDLLVRDVALRGLALPALLVVHHALVELAPPLVLHQEVALEDGLDDEVVFLVVGLQQILLHDGQLRLIDANEAALGLGDGHLLADLQVAIEEDLLAEGPADIDAPNQVLRLLRVLRHAAVRFTSVVRSPLRLDAVWHLEQQLAEQDDVYKVVLGAVAVERLIDAEVDDGGFQEERLERFKFDLAQQWVLLVEGHVRDIDRGRAHIFKLLLQLEEAILYLFFDVLGEGLLGADELGVLGVARLLHHAAPAALERLLELVDAAVRHR